MIIFRCIYCGQKIEAADKMSGLKGKCPRCGHTIRVLKSSTKLADSVNKLSDADLVDMYLNENTKSATSWFIKAFLPSYNKLSLFLTALLTLMIFVINDTLRDFIVIDVISIFKVNQPIIFSVAVIIVSMILMGLFFSLIYIFIQGSIPDFLKWCMLLMVVSANLFGALATYGYILNQTSSRLLWIFPAWNSVIIIILLSMLQYEEITVDDLIDEDVTNLQIIAGTFIAVAIFLLCNYVFKLYWSITYSACIVYATGFSRTVQEVLFPKTRQMEE